MLPRFVLILGSGRSGTSFLSRALNLNGLFLGKESDLMVTRNEPIPDNPLGHWENWKVFNINKKLEFLNLESFNSFKIFTKSYEGFEDDVKEIISELSVGKKQFGWKDPLMLYALDIWLPLLPEFKIVGIFRHPLKVAESDKIFHSTPYETTLGHWNFNNNHLLKLLKKYDGYLINFDWSKELLVLAINRISKLVGLSESADINNWFSDNLKRSDKTYQKKYSISKENLELLEKLIDYSDYSLKKLQIID